jgi:hypothetical protein
LARGVAADDGNLPELARTDDTVEFGKLFEQIALVALGQAAAAPAPTGTDC